MKTITLVDPSGKDVQVAQEQVVPLMRAGFGARAGQTVTLADMERTEVPIERLAQVLGMPGPGPRLETQQAGFERAAEERFGGLGGAAIGTTYGALQGSTLGLGGKALMATGLVEPETLAQLQQAQGGGLLTPVGLGEVIGGAAVLGPAGRALAPIGEMAAARGIGEVARTIGREAALGGAYSAGSELTQAGIEGRQANLLEAGLTGGLVGGTLGGVGLAAGKMAGKVMEKRAAAQAAKDIGEIPQQTAASVEREVAESKLGSQKESIRNYAKTTSQSLGDIVARINDTARQAEDLGFGLSGKGVKQAVKSVERLQKSLASIDEQLTSSTGLAPFEAELANAIEVGLRNKVNLAERRPFVEAAFAAAKDEYDAAVKAGAKKVRLDSLAARATKAENALNAFNAQEQTLASLGKVNLELAEVASQAATAAKGRMRDVGRYNATLRKLAEAGENAAELAGLDAQAAREVAAAAKTEAETLAARAGQAAQERIGTGVHSSRFSNEFAIPTLEAAKGAIDDMRAVVSDMFAVERGMAKQGVRTEAGRLIGAKKASVFSEMLRDPVVRNALTPENAAYAVEAARAAREAKLARTVGGAAKRTPGIPESIEARFAQEGGLRGLLGEERYAQIAAMAKADITAAATSEASEAGARGILERYKSIAIAPETAAQAEEAVARTLAEAPPVQVDAAKIVANDPAETSSLRKTLAGYEKSIATHDETAQTLAKRREQLVTERNKLAEQAQQARSTARRQALGDQVDAINKRMESIRTAEEATQAARDGLETQASEVRKFRTVRNLSAAEDAQRVAASREALSDAKRILEREDLVARRGAVAEKLTAAQQAKADMADLLTRHRAAQEELNAFISKGERYFERGVGGRIVPMSEQAIFDARFAEFMKSADGKAIADALKEAGGASFKGATPKEMAGILGAHTLASSLLGPALGTVATGIVAAAMSGKKGMWKAASTLMNPLRFWSATGTALQALSRGAPVVGRHVESQRAYTFPVKEANAFLDSVIAEREDAQKAFDQMVASGSVNAANIEEARTRYNAALDYLERKRPPTTNGSDAQAFARSVALLKDPSLIGRFVRDGSLRQQDVDLLQKVSPESYNQLKAAVALLHREQPQSVANLIPLFKIMTKSKFMMRTTLPLTMLQQMSGASIGAGQEVPMQPKSEAEAARGRAARSDKSSIASNVSNE